MRHYYDEIPNEPFTTVFVKNIPYDWLPLDLHKCFSLHSVVIGAFLYPTLDKFGCQYGLVEVGSPELALSLCQRGGFLHADSVALDIAPTNVKNLAQWLGGDRAAPVSATPMPPPGLGQYSNFLLLFFSVTIANQCSCCNCKQRLQRQGP